jgi:hypothetical protein
MPSGRRLATKVVVFKCPCGTAVRNRSPRRQRRRVRAMFVEAQVQWMKTSRGGIGLAVETSLAVPLDVETLLLRSMPGRFERDAVTAAEPPQHRGRHADPSRDQQRARFLQRVRSG